MANSNVSVANRLFAYIKYKEDVTDSIVDQYKQSLIFVGDEQQIYAPSVHAYVGIGMTAYNNTLQKIDDLQVKIDEAAAAVKGQVVSAIYPNITPEDIAHGKVNGASEATYLVSSIGLVGINDYNPSTNSVTNVRTVQVGVDSTGHPILGQYTVASDEIGYNNTSKPTSGINVRYHQIKSVVNGETVQSENVLYIDDSATWDYISYNSEVQYAATKKYVDSEINKVYHDLIGDTITYAPASWDNVFDSEATVNSVDNTPVHTIDTGVNYYYKVGGTQADHDGIDITPNGEAVYFKWQQASFGQSGELITSGDLVDFYPGHSGVPQLYVPSSGSDTYNTSIKDGINTLKEVAYLLDVLSDGTLGNVSYITYYEYTQLGSTTGWNVITNAEQNVDSIEPYAYQVTEGSAEDLGIKMAYSIAGNKLEIDHLHEHIRKSENGLTTVRSISANYNSNLGTLSIVNGSIPNTAYFSELVNGNNMPNGMVGDPTVALNLILTNTYLSINSRVWQDTYPSTANAVVNAGFGKQYYGEYLRVEPAEIDTAAARLASGENKIEVYVVETSGDIAQTVGTFTKAQWDAHKATAAQLNTIDSIKNGASAVQGTYYFIKTNPEYTRGEFDNTTWIKVSQLDLMNGVYADKSEYSNYYKVQDNSYAQIGSPAYDEAAILNPSNNVDLANIYVYKLSDVKAHELKPIIYSNTNAIATADWVSSYISQEINKVNAAQSNFESNIESLINSKLDNLDYEYKFADFESKFWNDYVTYVNSDAENDNNLVVGSTTYWQEYSRFYNSWKSAQDIIDPSSLINTTYRVINGISNSSFAIGNDQTIVDTLNRSTYESTVLVNVKQENGKISAEARELPTDKVNVNVDIWGESDSLDAQPIYAPLSECSVADVRTSINSLVEQESLTGHVSDILYNIKTLVNELYLPASVDQYEAVRAGDNTSGSTLYYYNPNTDSFVADNNISNATRQAIENGNHNYVDWKQYYKLVPSSRYIEVNVPATNYTTADGFTLSTIDTSVNPQTISVASFASSVYYIKGYKLSDGTVIDETSNLASYPGETVFAKLKNAVSSRKYITAEFDHNSAANGGHGENTLHVTTHITKIEDATPANTGLVDAWDVKSYIDQLFTFVDVSASINAQILANTAAFYTLISYGEYMRIEQEDRPPLYTKSAQGVFSVVSTPNTANYYANNVHAGNETGANVITRFNRPGNTTDYSPATHDYYVCHESVHENPLNLTLTQHGRA